MIASNIAIEIKSGENSCTYGIANGCKFIYKAFGAHCRCILFDQVLEVNSVGGITRLDICKEKCRGI